MSKRVTSSFFLLALGLLCLYISFASSTHELPSNLNKCDSLISTVNSAYGQTFEKVGLKWVTTKEYFYFKLSASNQQFAVDRTNEGFSDLVNSVRPGDTVKIYFRNSTETLNTDIYQIEKNGKIIESFKSYQQRNSSKSGIVLFAGILLILIALGYYYKLNLITILSWPVEGYKRPK
jgi:hypothetical protein